MRAPDENPRASEATAHDSQEPPDPSLHGKYVFPASTSQERLWFLREFDSRWGVAYHIPVAFRVDGPLNRLALQRAVNHLVERHESLRTRFTRVNGEFVQVINPRACVTVSLVGLEHVPEAERWDEVQRLLAIEARRPFRYTEDSLLRVALLRLTQEQHVLLLTIHHLVADGASVEVFIRELASSYDALTRGAEPQLPTLPVQYADYVAWQRQWLTTPEYAEQRAYWVKQLSGAPLVLELPSDRPRPTVQSFRGASTEFRLDRQLSASVRQLARENGSTLYTFLLTGFATLLHRYTGQAELLMGTPVANRHRSELEPLIGFLANTLVLRADLSGDPSVRELLQRLRETVQGAITHQQFPFEQVVEELHPERTLSRNPVFQVMFGLQEAPHAQLEVGRLTLTRVPIASSTSRFDLSFFLMDDGSAIQGHVEYSTDLFDAETVQRLVRHYTVILEGMTRSLARRVSQLTLLTSQERAGLLADAFHAKPLPAPAVLLPQLIEAQASRTPEAPALAFEGERLTYQELNRRANRLAHLLRARGVRPNDRVAVLLDRSPDMVVALLAVLKSGGAYVPVDPKYPSERVNYMLRDAQPAAVITRLKLSHLARGATHLIELENTALTPYGDENPAPVASAGHLAYVLYTSGSTGRPKGVMVTHEALANFLHSMAREPGLGRHDVLAAVTTFSFDIAALEVYLPLIVGAQVVLATQEQAGDARALTELLERHQVTVMQATPATWRMLVDSGWQSRPGFTILCGGEALPQDLADTLTANGATMWNLYGPTETTVWSSRKRLSPGARITLGKPLDNTGLYVLDQNLQPVPEGVCGELFIGGVGVARGYLGQPKLTAERFVPDPFSGQPGARLYRTGDLVRRRADGELEFIGRVDQQVKVRGFRIELGEIEATLRRHEIARDVTAIVWGTGDAARLVAYVVPAHKGAEGDMVQRLRDHARAHLPDYMVPSSILLLDALPLTPNGKVDRRALPDPRSTGASTGADFIAPRTATETRLASIWMRLLDCERVGIRDSFFELGGNSLLAGRLVQEIDRTFKVQVPMRDIFIDPTLAHLASVIEASLQAVPMTDDRQLTALLNSLSNDEVEALLNDPLLGSAREENR